MIEIRRARESDLPQIMASGAALHEACGLQSVAGIDEEYVLGLLRHVINTGVALLLVAVDGDELAGVALIDVSNFYFSPQARHATELLFWVQPKHRKRGIAERMLGFVDGWASAVGCKFLVFSEMSGLEGMGTFAAGHGFRPFQRQMIREVR